MLVAVGKRGTMWHNRDTSQAVSGPRGDVQRREARMARYSIRSKLGPEQMMAKAKEYFGEGGLGLEMTEEKKCCLCFEGCAGHVRVSAAKQGRKTMLNLETREWDHHVQRFIRRIG
jgi:hypothetical protein